MGFRSGRATNTYLPQPLATFRAMWDRSRLRLWGLCKPIDSRYALTEFIRVWCRSAPGLERGWHHISDYEKVDT